MGVTPFVGIVLPDEVIDPNATFISFLKAILMIRDSLGKNSFICNSATCLEF